MRKLFLRLELCASADFKNFKNKLHLKLPCPRSRAARVRLLPSFPPFSPPIIVRSATNVIANSCAAICAEVAQVSPVSPVSTATIKYGQIASTAPRVRRLNCKEMRKTTGPLIKTTGKDFPLYIQRLAFILKASGRFKEATGEEYTSARTDLPFEKSNFEVLRLFYSEFVV